MVYKRLNRLPPKQKDKSSWERSPILTYGAVLHAKHNHTEQMERLLTECNRWITRAYRGCNREKVSEITGIGHLSQIMLDIRIRWAASVYTRDIGVQAIVAPILNEHLEVNTELIWMDESADRERNGGEFT